jgi:hypothetical protein
LLELNSVDSFNKALKDSGWDKYFLGSKMLPKYFNGKLENAYNEYFSTFNHKVVSVEVIETEEDVQFYDIEVDKYHNFAVTTESRCGVFVHNSIVYGKSITNFAADFMKGDVKRASELFDTLFKRFPGMQKYIEKMHNIALTEGVVYGLFGDPMVILNPNRNNSVRDLSEAKRLSVNYPIQNSASNIAALSIYELDLELNRQSVQHNPLGFTHDAGDFEFDGSKLFEYTDILYKVAVVDTRDRYKVPVDIDWEVGVNMYDQIALSEISRDGNNSRIYKFKSSKSIISNIVDKLKNIYDVTLDITDEETDFMSYGQLFAPKTPYSLNIGSNVTYVKGTIKLVKISE